MMEMDRHIKCIARVRPLIEKEEDDYICASTEGSTISLLNNNAMNNLSSKRTFKLDAALNEVEQNEVFQYVLPYLESSLEGVNNSIFCYGQTDSGKTLTTLGYDVWSMASLIKGSGSPKKSPRQGPSEEDIIALMKNNPDDAGIIPRAMEWLLKRKEILLKTNVGKLTIHVSYLEVFNESLKDLLQTDGDRPADLYMNTSIPRESHRYTERKKDHLSIKQSPVTGETIVTGAVEVEVHNMDDVFALLWEAAKARSAVVNDMHAYSARAHTLFVVKTCVEQEDSNIVRNAKILFVDLAGNDKNDVEAKYGLNSPVGKTKHGQLEHRRETVSTNKSLASLCHVIQVLSQRSVLERREAAEEKKKADTAASEHHDDGNSHAQDTSINDVPGSGSPSRKKKGLHVPYRDSKLTSLVQDCLGKEANTLFICTLSPSAAHLTESISTMLFADRAMRVQVEPSRHVGTLAHSSAALKGTLEADSIAFEALREEHKKEVKRLTLLIKYLQNGICGRNADLDAFLDDMVTSGEAVSREKDLAAELIKCKNDRVKLEVELEHMREKLAVEVAEKVAICQIVYGEDCPQYEETEVPRSKEEADATENAKELEFFKEHGFHRHEGRSHRAKPEESKENENEKESPIAVPPPAPVAPKKILLPSGRKVDYKLQSLLLSMEKEAVNQRLQHLREWSEAEDQRWSFLNSTVTNIKEEVVTVGKKQEEMPSSPDSDDLAAALAGLRERVSLMETTFQSRERSLNHLNSHLMSLPVLMDASAASLRNPEKKGGRRSSMV